MQARTRSYCHLCWAILLIVILGSKANPLRAQSTEEQFHDLFITAGYASAFGAALGAAALSFKSHPEYHLRYVAVGASLGFIGGSILGSYIVFSPIFGYAFQGEPLPLASHNDKSIRISPMINLRKNKVQGWHTQWVISQF